MQLKPLTANQEALFERALQGKGLSLVGEDELIANDGQAPYAQLSSSQRRMWFIDQLTPGSGAYNVSQIFMLRGAVDREILFESVASVVERHHVLRACYPQEDGEPSIAVSDADHYEQHFHDLIATPTADREAQLKALLQREADRPFTLSSGPVFRANLVRTEEHVHFLQLVIHHIATDQTSLDIIDREISEGYAARVSGKSVELPPVTHQYSDYARWEAAREEGGRLDQSRAYWRQTLEALPMKLPIGKAQGSADQSANRRCDTVSELVSPGLDEQLTRMSVGENTTRFTTYLAALKALLSLATGQEDILVATPANNRTREAFEAIVGFFANTVVLRSKVRPEGDFLALTQDVGRGVVAALANQSLPFERVIQDSATDRSERSESLLQTMFVLVDSTQRSLHLPDIDVEAIDHAQSDAKFDMVWQVDRKPYGVVVSLQFASDSIERSTAEQLLRQYTTLLQALIESPQVPLAHHQLSANRDPSSDRALPAPGAQDSVAAVFRAVAASFQDKVAVETATSTISYRELDERSDRLAGVLSQHEDEVVGVVSAPGIDMIVSMLACLKANKIYVPIDASYPPERQRRIAQNAGLRIVLCEHEALAQTLTDAARPIVCINPARVDPLTDPYTGPITQSKAYILYTSGTTGVPKGVLQDQQNLLYFHRRYVEALALTAQDKVLALGSFGCDASVMDIFAALLTGATLSVLNLKEHNLQQHLGFIASRGVTVFHSTPSVFKYLFSSETAEHTREIAQRLRCVVMGGEIVDGAALKLAQRRLSEQCVFINGYGPSESTLAMQCISTVAELDPQRAANIGRAVPGTRVSLLNDQGAEVNVGDLGEIVIESPHVALAYWGDDAETAMRFIQQSDGSRRYVTGDYGRRNGDGTVDFVGRVDRQVKIRGHRVEPQEVEAQLHEHPVVRSAAVLPRVSAGPTQLIAHYVWDRARLLEDAECLALLAGEQGDQDVAGAPPGDAALEASFASVLMAFLSERLPSYMLPAALVRVENMPLNHHGKLDVAALPDPRGRVSTEPQREPVTDAQRRLVALWSERLGLADIGVDDDFFSLGGDSLMAMSLVGDVCESFSVDINISEFFEAPTVAALASVVRNATTRRALAPQIDAPRSGAQDVIELSSEQRQMWFTEQLDGSSIHFHLPLLYAVDGNIDVDRVERVLRATVERHQALRTAIIQRPDGSAEGKLLSPDDFVLAHRKLAPATESAISDALSEAKRQPFDLSRDFTLRATLIYTNDAPSHLLIVLHHIAADSWSLDLLHQHLMRELAEGAGTTLESPPAVAQYRDYARWQERRLTEVQQRRQLAYWEKQLADAPPVHNLRLEVPRTAKPDYTAGYVRRVLPAEHRKRLKAFASTQGMTLFTLMHAAFSLVLSRYSQTDDIVIGSPVANRPRRDFESLIGFFVNTVVLRVDCRADQRVGEFLEAAKRANLSALAHQDVSFEAVVKQLNPGRSNQYTPLFQIMLGMDIPESSPSPSLVSGLKRRRCPTEHAKYELSVFVTDEPDGLSLDFEFRSQLFSARTIEMMGRHIEHVLLQLTTAALADPLGDLQMLTPQDQTHLLHEMNRPPSIVAHVPDTVDQLIHAQVQRSPDATAFVLGEHRCTYREFENWANAIAKALEEKGLGPHARIGICLPSSPAAFAAMYAVMKLGGTFVPIDHTYPAERVRSIIEDSALHGAVTQANMAAVFGEISSLVFLTDEELMAHPERQMEPVHPGTPTGARAPVYILYTSGSTGKPKGVQISHDGAVNFLCGFVEALGITTRKTWLQLASVSFDITLVEWVACLATGGRCVIADDDVRMDAEGQVRLIEEQRVEVMQATPSRWRQLFASGWTVPHQVLGVSVGEPLSEDLVELFRQQPLTVWNCYGPTETTVYATVKNVCDPAALGKPVSIGRALPGYTHYICDKRGQLVPYGVIGELYLGGVGVGDGYFNRESLNKDRFVPHPWSEQPGARLYRTGDQVFYAADGELMYIGREDHQVKYRGYRVELGEIEFQLTQSPDVSAALVLLENPQSATPSLRAFLQKAEGAKAESRAMIDDAKQRVSRALPSYMSPHDYCVLDALPLTPNGKVDRAALLAMNAGEASAARAMPQSPAELVLAAIWEELLGVSEIALNDNFFNLGGQSLMAIKILSRIERVFKLELSLREFFVNPCIQGNVDALSGGLRDKGDLDEVAQLYELVADLSPAEVTELLEGQSA